MANELTMKNTRHDGKAGGWSRCFIFALFFLAAAGIVLADGARDKIFAQRAGAAFHQAQIRYQSHKNDAVSGWQFARTCFDWADWATNKTQRADVARQGMDACHQSLSLTNSAAAHYYLALNLGQLARVELFSGLNLVHEMSQEFDASAALDKDFDYAGAARGLGLLYRDAPGWPLSIGNKAKARESLESAVSLAPGDPENILDLAESDVKWGDDKGAKKQLAALDALWPKAQTNFTGAAWEQSWGDWTQRRDDLRKELK